MSDFRSSRTTMSSGTANDAWSLSAWTSVARYPSASSARANASVRKATVTAAAPGPRPSVTAARRAPTLRWSRRPASRTSGPKRRAAATAAANAIRPGRRSRTRPAFWLSASRDWSAAPPSRAATTSAIEPTAATSSRPKRLSSAGRHRGRDGNDQRRERRRRPPRSASPAGERTLSRSTAPTGAPARLAASAPTATPTSQPITRPGHGDDRTLGHGEEPQLPAPRPVPGEPPPGRLEIPPHAPRREDREGEEQGRSLAADEQEPPAGDGGRLLRRPELLDRSLHAVADRVAGQRCPRPLAPRDEAVDLPEPRPPRGERPHPGVAAVRVRGRRCPRERLDSLGDDERRGLRPVVRRPPAAAPERARDPRARCRSARGSRRRAGSSGASPSRPRTSRNPGAFGSVPVPAQPQHLAARRACRHAGGVRSSGGRTARDPSPRRARRSAPRPCSRGRGRWASGREGRCRELRANGRVERRDTPERRRPGRRTRPPAPSAMRPGSGRPPARRLGPGRSSCRRARRPAPLFRSRSRRRRGARRTSGDALCRTRAR